MEKIVNDILKEELYYEKLDNGLDVYFMPKNIKCSSNQMVEMHLINFLS